MRLKLFQYAILWHPTQAQAEKGEKSKVICPLNTLLAADQNSANMSAVMTIPEEYKDQLDQVEVALRPF